MLKRREQEAQSGVRKRSYLALSDVLDDLEKFTEANRSPVSLEIVKAKAAHLRRVLGDQSDVHALDAKALEKYTHERLTKLPPKAEKSSRPRFRPARETVRKELAILRQALRHAAKAGRYVGDPKAIMPDFKVPYVLRKRWLTEDDCNAMLEHVPANRRLWVELAVSSGARKSEVEGPTWGDIHFAAKQIHIRGSKTAKSDRTVPLEIGRAHV